MRSGYPAPPNGGNGGLSIRRRSIMLEVAQKEGKGWHGWNEDMWFVEGIKKHYNSFRAFPDQDVAMRFSFEAAPKGTYDWDWIAQPLGVHSGSSCKQRNYKYPGVIRKREWLGSRFLVGLSWALMWLLPCECSDRVLPRGAHGHSPRLPAQGLVTDCRHQSEACSVVGLGMLEGGDGH